MLNEKSKNKFCKFPIKKCSSK